MVYTSTIITFILLIGVVIYHVYLLVRKGHPCAWLGEEVNEYPLAPGQPGKMKLLSLSLKSPSLEISLQHQRKTMIRLKPKKLYAQQHLSIVKLW